MIEQLLKELIEALKENTEAARACTAQISAAPAPANVVVIEPALPKKPKADKKTAEPAKEEPAAEVTEPVAEEPVAQTVDEPAEQPAVEEPAEEVTATDIRNYVKVAQQSLQAKGKNPVDALQVIKDIREEFKVANLNDLKPEQCGPFLAKVKAALPL